MSPRDCSRLSPSSFTCPPPPTSLHSFPTRRSSDLARGARPREGARSRLSCRERQLHELAHVRRTFDERARADRKSTRLNSSHSSISYAVFCLKKKKTNNSTIDQTETSSLHR